MRGITMGMDHLLPGFYDELTKIAVSVKDSSFRQTRKGRRPIRVETLLKKETAFKLPNTAAIKAHEKDPYATEGDAKDYEAEAGSGFQEDPEE